MKKFLLASLLICASLGGFAFEPNTGGISDPSASLPEGLFGWLFKGNIKITTIRGAGGRDCPPGQGICSRTIEVGASAGQGMPTAPGVYAAVTPDGVFCLYTPDATRNPDFTGNAFKQTLDTEVEKAITTALKMGPYVIKGGTYSIEHRGKEAVIIFNK